MKFAVTSKGDSKSENLVQIIKQYLLDFELEYDEEEPDIVVSVGEMGHFFMHFIDTAIV